VYKILKFSNLLSKVIELKHIKHNFDFQNLSKIFLSSSFFFFRHLIYFVIMSRELNFFILFFQMNPVALNDIAFSAHAVLLSAFIVFQIAIYDVIYTCFSIYTLIINSLFIINDYCAKSCKFSHAAWKSKTL
jgi:hypothetical protein